MTTYDSAGNTRTMNTIMKMSAMTMKMMKRTITIRKNLKELGYGG